MSRLLYGLLLLLMLLDVAMSLDIATSSDPAVLHWLRALGAEPDSAWLLVALATGFVVLLALIARRLFADLRRWLERTLNLNA